MNSPPILEPILVVGLGCSLGVQGFDPQPVVCASPEDEIEKSSGKHGSQSLAEAAEKSTDDLKTHQVLAASREQRVKLYQSSASEFHTVDGRNPFRTTAETLEE